MPFIDLAYPSGRAPKLTSGSLFLSEAGNRAVVERWKHSERKILPMM